MTIYVLMLPERIQHASVPWCVCALHKWDLIYFFRFRLFFIRSPIKGAIVKSCVICSMLCKLLSRRKIFFRTFIYSAVNLFPPSRIRALTCHLGCPDCFKKFKVAYLKKFKVVIFKWKFLVLEIVRFFWQDYVAH